MHNLYLNLATANIVKNKRMYFPYILSFIGMVMMYYIMKGLATWPFVQTMRSAGELKELLNAGSYVVLILALIILYYTNTFLIKSRSKELGLYNVLGMQKKHIAIILLFENIIIFIVSYVLGILLGMVFCKFLCMLLMWILQWSMENAYNFGISFTAMIAAAEVFIVISAINYLVNIIKLKMNKPIELLRAGDAGEKEPKTKWILSIIGLGCLAYGYYLAISSNAPLKAINLILGAIILVIIGTYLLFTTVSIVILKTLKKNKAIYYKPNNFISISGMIYRMKQNAMGLASICILSCAVLTTISSTTTIYLSIEDKLKYSYPYDVSIAASSREGEIASAMIDEALKCVDDKAKNMIRFSNKYVFGYYKNNKIEEISDDSSLKDVNDLLTCEIMPIDDYNKIMNSNMKLADDEILVHSTNRYKIADTISILGKEFKVKDTIEKPKFEEQASSMVIDNIFIVINNTDAIDSKLAFEYANIYFDLDLNEQEAIKYVKAVNEKINKINPKDAVEHSSKPIKSDDGLSLNVSFEDGNIICDSVFTAKLEAYDLNGGFIFIGGCIGLLFIFATILIIYYKQISEGYEDRERFIIMKKVGMTDDEIKKAINNQVRKIFFTPVIVAILHMAVAYLPISKVLILFGVMDSTLLLSTMAIVGVVFILIYFVVYKITSRMYYKIVRA